MEGAGDAGTGAKETRVVEPPRPQSTVAGLAKEAAQLFHARSYQGCLLILLQLQLQLHNDEDPKIQKRDQLRKLSVEVLGPECCTPQSTRISDTFALTGVSGKVRHNIAVAEYYSGSCTNPHKLLEVLSQGCSEELARAAEEQQEENSPPASTSGSTNGSGGNGGLFKATQTNSSDVVAYMEDYDTLIPSLNTAVMMYHLQQYAGAMSVLEPLYDNIEPIDETAALRVCLLMLDITLASGQPGKAAMVLQYMEKAFGYLLPPAEGATTAPVLQSSTSPLGPESLLSSSEKKLGRTESEEGPEEEALTLGALEMEPSHSIVSRATTAFVVAAREKPIPPLDVKLVLHLYRVHLFLLTRNLKATKREIKSALNLSRENMAALLFKAQLEYSRGNYRKAIKQLTMCVGRAEAGMKGMLLSNLGCIHHRLRKEQTAALYFTRALHGCATSESEVSQSVPSFSQDRLFPILYNAGLQQLSCGNPILAARCFQEAAALYYDRPLLWLHLAECCIVALEKGLLENISTKREEVKVTVIGEGKWRRVVLPAGSLNPTVVYGALGLKLENPEGDVQLPNDGEKWFVSGQPHKLSVSFGIRCLRIALCLFDRSHSKVAKVAAGAAAAEVKDGDDSQSSKGGNKKGEGGSSTGEAKDSKGLSSAVAAYEEQRTQEVAALRVWALAALSYCQLGASHPLQALRSAELLLCQPACVRPYLLLGHIYAAEALCQLERPREALEHLLECLNESTAEPSNSGAEDESLKWKSGDNSEASGDGDDSATFTVGALGDAVSIARLTGPSARASLYSNLASVYAMQGDLQEAHRLAQIAFTTTPTNPLALLAVVYVELSMGQAEKAVTLLKQYRHLCVVSPRNGLSQHDPLSYIIHV